MIVRVQRFSRVHRLLPRIARRTLTEETPKVVSNDEILPSVGVTAPEPQETQRVGEMRKKDELRKKGIESLKEAVQKPLAIQDQLSRVQSSVPEDQNPANKVQQPLSEVHWALAEGYEAGGHLKYGTGLNRFDEKGLPTWGDWGVCVKIFDIGELTASPVLFLPNLWLRDNCRCATCVNQDTMQRALDTFSIPADILPKEVITLKEGLQVQWANDGHMSLYPWDWILRHRKKTGVPISKEEKEMQADPNKYWGSEIESNPPSVHYDEIMADQKGVGAWTANIRKYGFCYVDECPISPEKTQELLERIAFVRVTHYGGFYDFTSDLTMKDTAYTNLALPAHTDTTYFTDPAGLQMFHLLSHTEGEGGASLLVDGFNAARNLLKESRSAYEILSKTPIPWHASGNEGITITPAKKFPVFNFQDLQEERYPRLLQVRWNNDDRGVVGLREDYGMGAEKWYKAARKWNEILRRPEMEYWAQLKPGRPLIFDNWRVLHGRSAFTGKRRICGGYINHDDYVSRWRNTNFPRDEVLSQIL